MYLKIISKVGVHSMYSQNSNHSKDDCCCIQGIKNTVNAIKEAINAFPTVTLNLVITLNSGLTYNVSVSSNLLDSICVTDKVVKFTDVTISLCDIAKIKVLTGSINNPDFIQYLSSKLCKPHRCECTCNCSPTTTCNSSYDYLAMSLDDDIYSKYQNLKNYSYKSLNQNSMIYSTTLSSTIPCTSCPTTVTCNTCNANMIYPSGSNYCYPQPKPNPNNCGPVKDNCCCTNEIKQNLKCSTNNLGSISFNGSMNNMTTVNSISGIGYASVINSAKLSSNSMPFLANLNINTTTTPVVNSVFTSSATVVDAVEIVPTTVVIGLNTTTETVVSNLITDNVTVVNGVNLLPSITVVNDITPSTAVVSGPVTTTLQGLVSSITPLPETIVTDITSTTTAVVSTVTATTLAAVDSVLATTIEVVNAVTPATLAVVE
ncbi:MAG: hypothetical protein ACRCXA_06965, partial [Peptostreptococcaceae bacterium]